MNINITITTVDDGDVELELPAKVEVCWRCKGHGTHLTPSIGEHAYSMEEFNEAFDDDEDKDAYFQRGGMYDVTCHECHGKNVIKVVDDDACRTPELIERLKMYHEHERREAEYAREDRYNREHDC